MADKTDDPVLFTIDLHKGEQIFLGNGERSEAHCHRVQTQVAEAFSLLSALQQGIRGDDRDQAHLESVRIACDTFQALTGYRIPMAGLTAIMNADRGRMVKPTPDSAVEKTVNPNAGYNRLVARLILRRSHRHDLRRAVAVEIPR